MEADPQSLEIVIHPHEVLRQQAEPVAAVTDEVRGVAGRMIELMHEAPGVGLAAPQVGLSWRLFVVNATGEPGDDVVFINPRFIELGRDQDVYDEGCLSLPEITVNVRRPTRAVIEAQGLDGEVFRLESDEFPARVWQHEYDHLDGVLIIDKMSPTDRIANRVALKALEEG
ncbi:peptide deformylase [Mucisphaera calidilacus]|uniref:Peptide deformylase n=1 Tax=Mucisphaera calidilacus TaxID=2527982 RepID=A0A518BWM8_9BACT|nr:peptide deformylase [Mucisphaera calidilacus]QDU71376.1 Peptide deformylase [Mucisphaera calidilacus]